MIKSARANLEEAARTLGAYASKIEADPARLEEIDNRLQELTRLKRKYGGSIDTALETLERSRAEIGELEGIGESKAQVEAAMTAALDELAAHANKLSSIRKRAAADLGRKMETELKSLGMRSPGFEPRLGALGRDEAGFVHGGAALGPFGIDTVEFHLSPNVGQPAMPLLRIASGGELSRVMLALKRLEAQRRGVATMIFDEVDAGIGGAVAQVVGRKTETALALPSDSVRHASGANRGVRRPSSHRRKGRAARFDSQPRGGSGTRRSHRGDRANARRRSVRQVPSRRPRTARSRPRMTRA